MGPDEIKKIRNLPMYYLRVVPGEHQFFQFRNYYERAFHPDGSYERKRPHEVPAEGFTEDLKPLWPNCSQRCQGMFHDDNGNLHMLAMCRHKDSAHFTNLVSANQCQACPLKGK